MTQDERRTLGEVWWLARHARRSGDVVDEYALAALIDVETELETIEGLRPSTTLDESVPAVEAIVRALALARGLPGVPAALEGWLAVARRLVMRP